MGVKFLIDNWLMAVSAVGFMEISKRNYPNDTKFYEKILSVEDRYLLVDKTFWQKEFPSIYKSWAKENKGLIMKFHKNNARLGANVSRKEEPEYLEFKTHGLSEFVCQFCLERKAYIKTDGTVRVFEREIFTPLGSSNDIPSNFSGGRNNLYICKECESLIYCSSAGFVNFGNSYYFIYVEEDPITLWKLNSYFRDKVKEKEKSGETVRQDFLDLSFLLLSKVASIKLSRIYLIEISALGRNFDVFSSHIPREIVEVLNNNLSKFPAKLERIYPDILRQAKRKNLYPIIIRLLEYWSRINTARSFSSSESDVYMKTSRSLSLQDITFLLNFQKELEGGYIMDRSVYAEIARKISAGIDESRRQKLVYELLRHIRRKDIHGFMERLIFEMNNISDLKLSTKEREGLERLAFCKDFKSASLTIVAYLVGSETGRHTEEEEYEELQPE